MRGDDKVNILLVDDQPAKLLSYEVILRDIDENLIKASSGPRGAGAAAQDRNRGGADGRLHARARRLRARRDDPRPSALPQDRDHLHLRHSPDRSGPPARLRDGRGRLRSGAGRPGGAARQGEDFRRALSQVAAAGAAQCRARAAGRRPDRGARTFQPAAAAERGASQSRAGGRQDGLMGLGPRPRRLRLGRGTAAHIRGGSGSSR